MAGFHPRASARGVSVPPDFPSGRKHPGAGPLSGRRDVLLYQMKILCYNAVLKGVRALADRFGMPGSSCVIVLQREDGGAAPLTETIRELAPMEENDLLAEDGAGRVLMIKEGNDPA